MERIRDALGPADKAGKTEQTHKPRGLNARPNYRGDPMFWSGVQTRHCLPLWSREEGVWREVQNGPCWEGKVRRSWDWLGAHPDGASHTAPNSSPFSVTEPHAGLYLANSRQDSFTLPCPPKLLFRKIPFPRSSSHLPSTCDLRGFSGHSHTETVLFPVLSEAL